MVVLKNHYNFRVVVNTDFETHGIQIPGILTGDKVTGPSKTAVLCCLHLSWKELLKFSKM